VVSVLPEIAGMARQTKGGPFCGRRVYAKDAGRLQPRRFTISPTSAPAGRCYSISSRSAMSVTKSATRTKNVADLPPHSIQSEQAVLGSLLIDNGAYDRISELLSEDDFYTAQHRDIWRATVGLIEQGKPADIVTVADVTPDHADYISELFSATPSAYNIAAYAQTVRDRSILRQLIAAGADISAQALSEGASPTETAEQAEERVLRVLNRDASHSEAIPYKLAVFAARDWMEEKREGLSTGIPSLDRMTGGMQPGQLWAVGGRPSMGKSALAMQIAEHVGIDHPVAVYSLEMSSRQTAGRSIRYHESRLDSRDEAVNHLSRLKIVIDDGAKLTPGLLRLKLRRIKRKHGLSVLIVDYMQLMSTPKSESRLQEVSEVSRSLKQVAKEFGCTVIAVCQLNRAAEQRNDKRPMMSDLRESGQLEQDADVIVMVHREDYYNPETHLKGLSELLVRKCRDGQTGTAWCEWKPEVTRFKPFDGPIPSGPQQPQQEQKQRQRTVGMQDWSGRH
jgi:replicative DNA helicase